MKLPKRFALSTLLLLMFAVAAVFGFLTWRTNSLRSAVAKINDEGVGNITLSDGWFWPVLEDDATVTLQKDTKGDLIVAGTREPLDVVVSKIERTAEKMRQLGAQEIQIVFGDKLRQQGGVTDVWRVIHTENLSKTVRQLAETKSPR